MKFTKLAVAILASTALPVFATAITTDIVTVVDESGSMGGEHAWIGGMITSLDTALAAEAGADPFSAQYGLVGFGGGGGHTGGHSHLVGGGEFGTAAEFNTATGGLLLNGFLEDGYSGINTALGYTGQANSVRNIILVTDEDRDTHDAGLSYASMAADLASDKALLNAVINSSIYCGDNSVALGMDSDGTGYKADGSGGFTTCAGAYGSGNSSWNDYALLAFGTGGAAWDLNQLRAGGLTADSFTAAFVDIKVQETIIRTPEPSSLGLLGLGLAGLIWGRKKAKA
ncbi:PEP-CTERM sorting domain-containing protein [Dasania sp. GY-MA-18]|uniref:PEP-CTERM sorting domain-containing protein n=1 Tax=Dasania phycosphaerae TaxID=2950436 RepID=A0A9J6RKR9_9GAMM|nr:MULTISPECIES: PEP-CTERM sorting domain-containing protein [Dasania]MCR8922388.1 PEP-CTERM sorting domain-containing protein [Dasania sp. GY-MA-18]MCZ0864816.1 PEP-CTERM sorting domain-containing protein [Dasania phycosphaerae]MCZ0868544.1 PEP-CTERM sorting domain-containing protein [Dasania phycosphaerae]